MSSSVPFRAQPTGRELARESWRMLKEDRGLIVLPFLGVVFSLLFAAIFALPGLAIGAALDDDGKHPVGYIAAILLGLFGAALASTYFQAAVVAGAIQHAEGSAPTLGSALRGASKRLGTILGFAAISAIVGTVFRLLRDRAGAAGDIAAAIGGLAWGIATYLVLPVIVVEGGSPVAAIKKSSGLLKKTWGSGLRITVRFGLIQLLLMLPGIALLLIGVVLFDGSSPALGLLLAAIGVLIMVLVGVVFSAITAYAKALMYRFAHSQPTPGIETSIIRGAAVAKV